MSPFLACLTLFALAEPPTVTLNPTDDLWVYSHASDPAGDTYMRIWGADGLSVADTPDDSENFSYGYLRFDLSKVPEGAKLTGATLKLTHAENPTWTLGDVKNHPLEVRALQGIFTEKTWNADMITKVSPVPGAGVFYGAAAPTSVPDSGTFPIVIDLTMGKANFTEAVQAALKTKEKAIYLALCCNLDPADAGRMVVYKVFTKEGPEGSRPELTLTFDKS